MLTTSVNRINTKVDLVGLQRATDELLKKYPLNENRRQLCFNTAVVGENDVFEGIGSFYDPRNNSLRAKDFDYRYLIEEFKGGFFENIFEQLKSEINPEIFRMRLMMLPPRTCYSFHFDMSFRYHIAIQTDPTAFMIFKDEPPAHIPADGYVYRTHTTRWHSAMNCSDKPRLHLVVCSKK